MIKVGHLILLFLIVCSSLFSQTIEAYDEFEKRLKEIQINVDLGQFSKSMDQLYELRNENFVKDDEVNYARVTIELSEVFRLTGDASKGVEVLEELPKLSDLELDIAVQCRIVSLMAESPDFNLKKSENTSAVMERLGKILPVARENKLYGNVAELLNLKAYLLKVNLPYEDYSLGQQEINDLYRESSSIFLSLGDTINYHNLINQFFQFNVGRSAYICDSTKDILFDLVSTSKSNINKCMSYSMLGNYYGVRGDSLNYYKYHHKAAEHSVSITEEKYSREATKIKTLYETDVLKAEVAKEKEETRKKARQVRYAIIAIVIISLLFLGVITLIYRQRVLGNRLNKTNQVLKDTNDRYKLLVKESNHRIKNNLQMILSLIEYSKSDPNDAELSKISSKIATISTLHRSLTFEDHNEKVSLNDYFNEIINQYQALAATNIKFNLAIDDVWLESERIVYFGLILNEMISNTLEHAVSCLQVNISVIRSEKSCKFVYCDGSEFIEGFEKNKGLILIEELTERVGGTHYQLDTVKGEYKFVFSE